MEEKDIRIVVTPGGWVHVGYWEQEGDEIVLKKAKNIRRWGTAKGLAQLANSGPLKDTVLEEGATMRTHRLQIYQSYDCVLEKWLKHL